jgi:phosphocarrier protein HPr
MSTQGPIRRTVKVANPNGLHMRPATAFAVKARTFTSRIHIILGNNKADGKSPFEILMLVAMPGVDLTLEIDGPDATDAMEPLCEILSSLGDE